MEGVSGVSKARFGVPNRLIEVKLEFAFPDAVASWGAPSPDISTKPDFDLRVCAASKFLRAMYLQVAPTGDLVSRERL